MDKIWLLYGYYRYSPLRCPLKSWDYPPSDEDQNEVKRIGGFDGYELRENGTYNQGDEMIYVAFVDEVPTLSTVSHEICDPDPLTEEEIVTMWDALKKAYEKILEASKEMK